MPSGVVVDHFGLAADTTIGASATIKCISSSQKPTNQGADAQDSLGTYNSTTRYDSKNDYSCEYLLAAGSLNLSATGASGFHLGKVIAGKVITGIQVVTSNTAFPKITISGPSTVMADSNVGKFDPLIPAITGTKTAQKVGVVLGTNTKLVGSSVNASCSYKPELDSQGAEACGDVEAGRVEATNDGVRVATDSTAAFTADTGWTKTSGPDNEQRNTAYPTHSFSVQKNLVRS